MPASSAELLAYRNTNKVFKVVREGQVFAPRGFKAPLNILILLSYQKVKIWLWLWDENLHVYSLKPILNYMSNMRAGLKAWFFISLIINVAGWGLEQTLGLVDFTLRIAPGNYIAEATASDTVVLELQHHHLIEWEPARAAAWFGLQLCGFILSVYLWKMFDFRNYLVSLLKRILLKPVS